MPLPEVAALAGRTQERLVGLRRGEVRPVAPVATPTAPVVVGRQIDRLVDEAPEHAETIRAVLGSAKTILGRLGKSLQADKIDRVVLDEMTKAGASFEAVNHLLGFEDPKDADDFRIRLRAATSSLKECRNLRADEVPAAIGSALVVAKCARLRAGRSTPQTLVAHAASLAKSCLLDAEVTANEAKRALYFAAAKEALEELGSLLSRTPIQGAALHGRSIDDARPFFSQSLSAMREDPKGVLPGLQSMLGAVIAGAQAKGDIGPFESALFPAEQGVTPALRVESPERAIAESVRLRDAAEMNAHELEEWRKGDRARAEWVMKAIPELLADPRIKEIQHRIAERRRSHPDFDIQLCWMPDRRDALTNVTSRSLLLTDKGLKISERRSFRKWSGADPKDRTLRRAWQIDGLDLPMLYFALDRLLALTENGDLPRELWHSYGEPETGKYRWFYDAGIREVLGHGRLTQEHARNANARIALPQVEALVEQGRLSVEPGALDILRRGLDASKARQPTGNAAS